MTNIDWDDEEYDCPFSYKPKAEEIIRLVKRSEYDRVCAELAWYKADAERLAVKLNNLANAVAYDLRHADDEDEDKSWDALTKLKDALEGARAALAAHAAGPEKEGVG